MAEFYYDRNSEEAKQAPAHVHYYAALFDQKIVKIIWDKEGGYPAHAWGYVQWTTRPFVQTQGCDGTIDLNVHLIGIELLKKIGLDYAKCYDKAYSYVIGFQEQAMKCDTNKSDYRPMVEAEKAIKKFIVDLQHPSLF